MKLRPATPADLALLRHWDEQPHVRDASDDDWGWEVELQRSPAWREQLIAEVDGRPIGFVQIIDPRLEDGHYWASIRHLTPTWPGCAGPSAWGDRGVLAQCHFHTPTEAPLSRDF